MTKCRVCGASTLSVIHMVWCRDFDPIEDRFKKQEGDTPENSFFAKHALKLIEEVEN